MRIVADELVSVLRQLGADVVFTLCGNHVLPLYEALRTHGLDISVVDMRSEGAAVMAADAYARVARRVGVVIVTGGPGLTNCVTGLLTAQGNRSPVLVISGEPGTERAGQGDMQELDHVAATRAVVKWSERVVRADQAGGALATAWALAETGRSGPVHVSVPVDVLRAPLVRPGGADRMWRVQRCDPPPSFVRRAADALSTARRPALVIRAGAWQGGGEDAIAAIAERGPIPVFTLDSARGILPDAHPCSVGYADASLSQAAAQLGDADVAVVVGGDLDFRLRFGEAFASDATLVHVDADPVPLGRNRPDSMTCAADPAAFLRRLAQELPELDAHEEWLAQLQQARSQQADELRASAAAVDGAIHPAQAARALARAVEGRGATRAFDCGEFVQWCRQLIPADTPGRWLRLGPQSTCGAGLPFGLGAAVASEGRWPTLVIAGDGGLGYHITEIETSVRRGLPLVVVVGSDGAWGVERNLQQGIYGQAATLAADLGPTDYAAVARGFGAQGTMVAQGPEELEAVVATALENHDTTLVQFPVASVPSRLTRGLIQRERQALDAR